MSPLDDLHRAQQLIGVWKNDPHGKREALPEAQKILERYIGQIVKTHSPSGMGNVGELREVIPDVAGLRLRFTGSFSYQPFVHRMVVFDVVDQ
jgi:hypothetical protein